MTKSQHDGPVTQEQKQFGVHPRSIDATLHRASKEVQERYAFNRRRFQIEQALMKRWADEGFVSHGGAVDEEDNAA